MKKLLLKIIDLAIGLFLLFMGFVLLLLYSCLHTKADNGFIFLCTFLFLLCFGIISIILGVKRIYATFKNRNK
jgi:hypothetical protein